MTAVDVATALRAEAGAANERRLLVLAGDRERGYDALESVLDALAVSITDTTLVGPEDRLRCEHAPAANADRLLGTTRQVVILDAHRALRPNTLGSVVGCVDGGGLLVLLAPPLAAWPERRDGFDESLAVPPFAVESVTGLFRRRLVDTLRAHPGIAIVDVDAGAVERDGLTHPAPRLEPGDAGALDRSADSIIGSAVLESTGSGATGSGATDVDRPDSSDASRFPSAAYDACLTADQAEAVRALETLSPAETGGPRAVVLEANRGRGKSSAAGLAAGSLVAAGYEVLVTAPAYRNAAEVFERTRELLGTLGIAASSPGSNARTIETADGGRLRYLTPAEVVGDGETRTGAETGTGTACPSIDADAVVVDEAAALPVRVLEALLSADRVAFATTVHGYEGAGRGFSVRFRDRLAASEHAVTDVTLREPIRYAAGDPVETWAFRALLLDARPPVEDLVTDATPETVEYHTLEPATLAADEHLLREAFGLLVLAHYRTEPDDLARLLDAPNLETRALLSDGHVVSVALLAREGNLPEDVRAEMYEGGRIRGNMLPDVLTSQLRDERAGETAGLRVMRIATHHAVRSRGLGSLLLERIREEFAATVDWLGTGFGATPGLLEFWRTNGYRTVHCSTTRNDASGEYSALMLAPTSDSGRDLHDRHARRFASRFPAVCSDALDDLDPDVARALLRSVDADPSPLALTPHEWRVVAGAAYGPGLFDIDPGPFRDLALRYFLERDSFDTPLSDRAERLLVRRAFQAREWPAVADELAYHSTGQCMRALGDAFVPLVDRYGDEAVLEVRERFRE